MKIKPLISLMAFLIALVSTPAGARAEENVTALSFASVSTDLSRADATLLEKYLIQPSDQVKLVKYLALLPALMKDRAQTLQLGDRGFEENNPLLGRRPTGARINSYFLVYAASLFAAAYLPEPFASSILDSVRYQEEIVVNENERLFERKAVVSAAPIAFMFTILY